MEKKAQRDYRSKFWCDASGNEFASGVKHQYRVISPIK